MNNLLALFCVSLFSLTVPATRTAAQDIAPEAVTALRLLGAALVCLTSFLLGDRWVPPRRAWAGLLATSFGSVWGFSFFIAVAMKQVPGSHGAIALATLPVLTGAYASFRDWKNPGARYWFFSSAGTFIVLLFFLRSSSGALGLGDSFLVGAVLVSAFGYVEGARLSREFGGRRIMTWAVLLAIPMAFLICYAPLRSGSLFPKHLSSWVALFYLAAISQSLGMFLWYRVLSKGDMARIALIQLVQPFLTIAACAYWLEETINPSAWVSSTLVVLCVLGANLPGVKKTLLDTMCKST
jgi:drug/metabolite transporter (DMT)-like permease